MKIETSTAKVYHGGNRRWLSRKAAEKAEALKIVRKLICDCEQESPHSPGHTCAYHKMESEHIPALKDFVIQTTEHFTREIDDEELMYLILDHIQKK